MPSNRDQAFLLAPDLKAWLPEDDLAYFVVAAVERVPLGSFEVPRRTGGKPQYHPWLMLALLIHCYANGIFSSRRIEGATYRDAPSFAPTVLGMDATIGLPGRSWPTPASPAALP